MVVRWWSLVLAVVLVGVVGCSGPLLGPVPPLVETEIVSFEVSPERVSPGGAVMVSWRAVQVGRFGGVPYCTLQWTVRGGDPEEALEVACEGSLEVVVPDEETVVEFRFSALRRGGSTFVTRNFTVTVAVDDEDADVAVGAAP